MKKKTVLFVVSEDWSFVSHRLGLARSLKENGYDVHVACRVQDKGLFIQNEGFHLHDIDLGRGSLSPIKALKSVSVLRALYQKIQPNLIVHVALFPSFLGSLASFVGGGFKHLNMITGLGFIFISESLKAQLVRSILSVFFWLFSKFKKTHLIVQNKDDLSLMKGFGFKPDQNLYLIPGSGVDHVAYQPAQSYQKDGDITFVGRMLWAKGVNELVEAGKILKEKGKPYKITFVGDPDVGNPQSTDQKDIDHWQEQGWINYLGRQSNIREIYQSSALAVLPSWREGFPKSLLEAAACGLPMITTDVAGCRDMVRDGVDGLLVPLKDAQKLADAIEILMEDPERRQKMGIEARKRIETELNEAIIAQKTVAIIEQLIDA